MKPTTVLLTFCSSLALSLFAQNQAQDAPAASTPYAITQKGANHSVWERTVMEPGPFGKSYPRKHTYKQLAAGLHYFKDNQWLDSDEQIQIQPQGGAVAQHGQHQVSFPADLYNGTLQLTTPDGKILTSRPLGLSYFDGENSSLIAALKPGSVGQILPSGNQIIYTNICTDFKMDLLVTYKKSGLESDLVLRENLPNPQEYGFTDVKKVRLQWLTEFINTDDPVQSAPVTMPDGLSDATFKFGGVMRMVHGNSFSVGDQDQPRMTGTPVSKSWQKISGRTFLVEELPYSRIEARLSKLAALSRPATRTASLAPPLRKLSSSRVLPIRRASKRTAGAIQLAKAGVGRTPGLVLDYSILTGETDFTFEGNTTYYVTDPAYFNGTTKLERGVVVKLPPLTEDDTANITIFDDFICQTTPYGPAVFTSRDDDSCGEVISGSTGSPSASFQPLAFSYVSTVVANLQFRYGQYGLICGGGDADISNVQFVHCEFPFWTAMNTINMHNVLFSDVTNAFVGFNYTINGEHITINRCAMSDVEYYDYLYTDTLNLTNSLIVDLGSWGTATLTTDSTVVTNGASSIFQTVVGGSAYLLPNSPYLNAGTTNITPSLLADIRKMTTYPPIVFSNATISADTTFYPQAQRDTDPNPALGYHYWPLDFVFTGTEADANLTFAPGTVAGWFRTSSGWYHAGHGIHIGDGYSADFNGTVEQPVYFVRCNTVQEEDLSGGYGPGGITGWAWPDFGQAPQLRARFTRFCALNDTMHFRDDWGYLIVHAANCEFWGGYVGCYASQQSFTNCLFDRTGIWTSWDGVPATDCSFTMQNCLMHGGYLNPNRWAADAFGNYCPWAIHDSAFDATAITFNDAAGGDPSVTAFDHNAALNGADGTSPPGAHDIITNLTWVAGPLGNFYQPATSSLINTGSVTADLVGLYHFTVTTNLLSGLQIKETNSIVDISYHYVALDIRPSIPVPIDTDGDGIPDYIEDTNGNGITETNETSFTDYYNGVLPILTVAPGVAQNAHHSTTRPVRLAVVVSDTHGTLLTNAPLTFSVDQGPARLALSPTGAVASSQELRTGPDGQATVFFILPNTAYGVTNVTTATAASGTNTAQLIFTDSSGSKPMIAAGSDFALVLNPSARVLAFGRNLEFQLANQYSSFISEPTFLTGGITNIRSIAACVSSSYALDDAGDLWAWGGNQLGELGNGYNGTNLWVPDQPIGMSNVYAISAQRSFAMAAQTNGTVWQWGYHIPPDGFLSLVPTQVLNLTNPASISAGASHGMALMPDGTVETWGNNSFGQLGDGTHDDHDDPQPMGTLTNILQVSAGARFSLALQSNGVVWACGANYFGELGIGNWDHLISIPTQVSIVTNIVQVASGFDHALALDADGKVWAWGGNFFGELGAGATYLATNQPVRVLIVTNIISLVAGNGQSCALDSAGNIWFWGTDPETGFLRRVPAVLHRTGERPSVTITGPANGSTFLSSGAVAVSGYATDTDGWVEQLSVFYRNQLVGSPTNNPFTFLWQPLPAANGPLRVQAVDDSGSIGSADVNISILADTDGDGVSDIDEIKLGTDPTVPNNWSVPGPDPADHSPPAISLDEPKDATPL